MGEIFLGVFDHAGSYTQQAEMCHLIAGAETATPVRQVKLGKLVQKWSCIAYINSMW